MQMNYIEFYQCVASEQMPEKVPKIAVLATLKQNT